MTVMESARRTVRCQCQDKLPSAPPGIVANKTKTRGDYNRLCQGSMKKTKKCEFDNAELNESLKVALVLVSLFRKAELVRGEEETDKFWYKARLREGPSQCKSQLSEFRPRGEKVDINVYLRRFDQSQETG